MKKRLSLKRVLCALLAIVLVAGLAVTALAAAIPAKVPAQSGVTVYQNAKAAVDASNLADGYVSVKYTGGKDVRIKVRITKSGTTDYYDYNLNNKGTAETFPLTEGDGEYTIGVYENTQNATWQGTVTWTDGKRTEPFHSALELIKLIDSALEEEIPQREGAGVRR